MAVLRVATCQFPVSADIGANLRYILRQISVACQRGAADAHFPEGALSGYAGTDFEQRAALRRKTTSTIAPSPIASGRWHRHLDGH